MVTEGAILFICEVEREVLNFGFLWALIDHFGEDIPGVIEVGVSNLHFLGWDTCGVLHGIKWG